MAQAMEQEDRQSNDLPITPKHVLQLPAALDSSPAAKLCRELKTAQNQERPQSLKFDVSEEESGSKGEERPGMKAG